jgi:hypothetical protein
MFLFHCDFAHCPYSTSLSCSPLLSIEIRRSILILGAPECLWKYSNSTALSHRRRSYSAVYRWVPWNARGSRLPSMAQIYPRYNIIRSSKTSANFSNSCTLLFYYPRSWSGPPLVYSRRGGTTISIIIWVANNNYFSHHKMNKWWLNAWSIEITRCVSCDARWCSILYILYQYYHRECHYLLKGMLCVMMHSLLRWCSHHLISARKNCMHYLVVGGTPTVWYIEYI